MRDYLKKSELWAAAIMFVLHVVLFPVLIGIVEGVKPGLMSASEYNFVYYCLSTVLAFVLLGGYLRRSFDSLLDNLWGCLKAFVFGWLIYYALATVVGSIVMSLDLSSNNPNNDAMVSMIGENSGMMLAAALFLAPIVEECIFRGGIFCGLHHRSRVLAYAVSIILFSVYHVWQFILAYGDWSYLIACLSYVPAAFVLCWVYEKSGSLWTSILFHISNNLYAFSIMTTMM